MNIYLYLKRNLWVIDLVSIQEDVCVVICQLTVFFTAAKQLPDASHQYPVL